MPQGELHVNVDAKGGSVQAAFCDSDGNVLVKEFAADGSVVIKKFNQDGSFVILR